MGINAKEIAKKMGISEAAVSMALHNKKGVSEETRNKIINFAKENNYDFNRFSTDFEKGTICFIVYRKSGAIINDNPFFSLITEGISLGCKKNNYHLNISYLYEDEDIKGQVLDLKKENYSGYIILATEMDKLSISNFSFLNKPVVILDAYFQDLNYNYVIINNKEGALKATNYLISKYQKQPGYLRSSYKIPNFDERADGFYKAIRNNGMSSSKSIVHNLTPSQEGAYLDMLDILNNKDDLASCYFADNDLIAIGALKAFIEKGYKVPEDIAIIGFDNISVCEYVNPSLTTIDVPKKYLGEIAVDRIISIIKDENIPSIVIEVNTNLIKRKSA